MKRLAALMKCQWLPLLFLAAMPPASTSARTWIVRQDGTADALFIGDALGATAAGDTVLVTCGVYYEHDLSIDRQILLTAESTDPSCVIIDGNGANVVLSIGASGTVVRNLTITGGSGVSSAVYCGRNMTFSNCVFRENECTAAGGAVGVGSSSTTRFEDCLFRDNTAARGGAVYTSGDGIFEDCRFESNTALSAGRAADLDSRSNRAVITVLRCLFLGGQGRHINLESGSMEVSGCRFESATDGAIFGNYLDSVTLDDCTFEGNNGGGVILEYSAGAISRCVFRANTHAAKEGGALRVRGSELTVTSCTLQGNSSQVAGGALWIDNGSIVDLDRCVVWGNDSPNGTEVGMGTGAVATATCSDIRNNIGWFGGTGSFTMGAGSFSLDPRFCSEAAGVLSLQSGSPCVDAGDGCGLVGALGVACAPRFWVSTDPPGLVFGVDGTVYDNAVSFDWSPNSQHELSTEPSQQPTGDTRATLVTWSDGLPATHTIIVPDEPMDYIASFDVQYQVTVEWGPGGTALPPSGWWNGGDTVQLSMLPDVQYAFDAWVGNGFGSFSGTDPSPTITVGGPITQRATFRYDGSYRLTMVAGTGGSVDPATGDFHAGSVVPIQAAPNGNYTFVRWTGQGAGSVNTSNPSAVVTMNGPITQTASFRYGGPLSLTMIAGTGGSVTPASGVYPQGNVPIQAIPELGYVLNRWTGQGPGSYSGTAPAVTVHLADGAITETASFTHVGLQPLTVNVVGQGAVRLTPDGESFTTGTPVELAPWANVPGWDFHYWLGEGNGSYTGTETYPVVIMGNPITETIYFAEGGLFPLTVTGTEGGAVLPEGASSVVAGSTITIRARADSVHRFVRWEGTGPGSYSGTETDRILTIHGPTTQHAFFEEDGRPTGYEFRISASATDPFVQTDLPRGADRHLHLWLICAERGAAAMEAGISTTMPVSQFLPKNGMINFGTAAHLFMAIPDCPTGEVNLLMGSWIVTDDGGSFCLTEAENGVYAVADCDGSPSAWSDPVCYGFSSTGEEPCLTGRDGCGEEESSVELSGLDAFVAGRVVVVTWRTTNEIHHDGFHVYRSDTGIDGQYRRLTTALLRGSSPHEFRDSEVTSDAVYAYLIGAVDGFGVEDRYGPVRVRTPVWRPLITQFSGARPSPFRSVGRLHFTLARESEYDLSIYDVTGRLVRRYRDAAAAGEHVLEWDGRNEDGSRAPGGVYFSTFRAPGLRETRKLVLLGGG